MLAGTKFANMGTFHGILQNSTAGVLFGCNYNIRHQLLLFDKLIIFGCKEILEIYKLNLETAKKLGQEYYEYLLNYIEAVEYLYDQNIMTDISIDLSAPELEGDTEMDYYRSKFTYHHRKGTFPRMPVKDKDVIRNVLQNIIIADSIATRAIAAFANRSSPSLRAVPLVADLFPIENKKDSVKTDMLLITLKKLPIIDSSVPIKTVLEYKNEESKHLQFLKLINWMNTLSKNDFSPNEFEEHIDYLIAEYESNLKLHKLKYKYSSLQTIVNIASEFIENAIKLKFKSATDAIFDIKKRKIEMLMEEKNLGGAEVAYIVSSNSEFRKKT